MASYQTTKSFKLFKVFPVIAFGLGSWQVYRYQWKKDLISKAQENVAMDPLDLSDTLVDQFIEKSDSSQFRRVLFDGKLIQDKTREIYLGPRTHDGNIGYYVLQPFQLANSSKVFLLNRGWVSSQIIKDRLKQQQQIKSNNNNNSSNEEDLKITGLIGKPKESGSVFTPVNDPQKNNWYSIDVQQMSEYADTLPLIVNVLEEQQINNKKGDQQKQTDSIKSFKRFDTNVENSFYNKHMSYIFTWYTLSGCLSLIYYKYMRPVLPIIKK